MQKSSCASGHQGSVVVKRKFICNIFTPCFGLTDQIKKEISSLSDVEVHKAYKCTLKTGLDWKNFFLEYYSFVHPPHERELWAKSQKSQLVKQKAEFLENLGKEIIVFEVKIKNPKMLCENKFTGPRVPEVLDGYKVNLRRRVSHITSKYTVMHVFDTDLYNEDIINFLVKNCKIKEV